MKRIPTCCTWTAPIMSCTTSRRSRRAVCSAAIRTGAARSGSHYYGGDFRIEHPTGSGILCTFDEIADDLSQRLIALFERDSTGQRPCNGSYQQRDHDPLWNNYVLFHEYFHGDNGSGLGAAHQTGWTGLVATLIQEQGKRLEQQSVKGEDHRGKSDGMDGSLS
jgi:hypothetical protein